MLRELFHILHIHSLMGKCKVMCYPEQDNVSNKVMRESHSSVNEMKAFTI